MGFFTKKQVQLDAIAFSFDDYEELNHDQLIEVNGGCGGGFWAGVKNFFSGGKSSSSSSSGSSSGSGSSSSTSSSTTTSSSNGGCGGSSNNKSTGNNGSSNGHTDVIVSYQKNGNDTMSVSEFSYDSNGKLVDVKTTEYNATNNVRTPEERGAPVEYNGYNYYPEQFPTGSWELGKSQESSRADIGPVKIPTNANQDVTTYTQNSDGSYTPTGTTNDSGYLIHSGEGSTTWGCIKMSDADVASVATTVNSAIDSGGNAKILVY